MRLPFFHPKTDEREDEKGEDEKEEAVFGGVGIRRLGAREFIRLALANPGTHSFSSCRGLQHTQNLYSTGVEDFPQCGVDGVVWCGMRMRDVTYRPSADRKEFAEPSGGCG